MTEVIMPKMGDGMEEGTLLEWLKKEGDKVKSGEVIGSIQTDKATLELEAPGSGTLAGILLQAGGTVPVGQPIAAILRDGETLPANWGTGGGASAPATAEVVASASAAVAEVAAPVVESDSRIKASPLARKIAAELGVNLATIQGTGPGGRIVEKDVRVAPAASPTAAPAPVAAPAPQVIPTYSPLAEDKVVPLSRIKQITGQRTLESKTQVPHFYVTVEVDVEKILDLRKQFEDEKSGKVSINDFVVKACALALREVPEVNSIFQGKTLTQLGGVHVGIAVALPDGLTVPVVQNADQLSLRQISSKVKDLAGRARDNKLKLDEMQGSTFSISNMGMMNVDTFIAIVNQPNAAIVAIASVRKKVVVNENDEIEVRSRMNISGSFDHRILDGAGGAKFMNVVREYLENPTRLLS